MKTILLALIAAAALAAAAAPAAAQPFGAHQAYAPAYGQRTTGALEHLDWKITSAAQQGRISWREARDLRGEVRQLQPAARRVETGRANGFERQRFERAVARIEIATNGYAQNDRSDWRHR